MERHAEILSKNPSPSGEKVGGLNIIITRKHFLPNCTIGTLEVKYEDVPICPIYICDTLEPHTIDWSKEKKVKGKTAIPCGRYKVTYRLSMKFGRKMPFLENVPNFEGIMMHWGNHPRDSKGCILVGHNPHVSKDVIAPRLVASRTSFYLLEKYIMKAFEKNEPVYVEVKDVTL